MSVGKSHITPADLEMEFDWPEFWIAVKGRSNAVIVAYLHALTYYFHHLHCRGVLDDDKLMRSICECDQSDWREVKPIVFGDFFKKEDGLWHQKRNRQLYAQKLLKLEKNRKRAETAAKERWKNKR
jgi:uncharacterized protein YdaU (DUF1376 family)